jgi:hypothetical protein
MMKRDDLIYTLGAVLLVAGAAFLRWHEALGCLREYAWTVCVHR